ncbi:MAG: hypothetical protein KatS3mg105_2971 [Gemmatales bacterium]|nr:MAG: hypothetical protein KatS3mg105_2971 [Gemmatales bacterium]
MIVSRLLHVRDNELARLWPFFFIYLFLFAALTLADGVSLALYVQEIGAERLPTAYALIALLNFALVTWYLRVAPHESSVVVFKLIVGSTAAIFASVWLLVRVLGCADVGYRILYIGRELSLTLVLLHFGTYLQDFFTRPELNRVLPIVYAGGRVGGMVGALLLELCSHRLGVVNLILVVEGLLAVAFVGIHWTTSRIKCIDEPTSQARFTRLDTTPQAIWRLIRSNRLMFWLLITSFTFMVCRWLLNFLYNSFFEQYFIEYNFIAWLESAEDEPDTVDMAQFLGRYTWIALFGSLVMQLFVVNRLVERLGIGAAHFVYAALVASALSVSAWTMTLPIAICCRFIESELRFALRNPLMQLMTNQFPKPVRTVARSLTMGYVTPIATMCASGLLLFLASVESARLTIFLGVVVGLVYLVSSVMLWRILRHHERESLSSDG